MLVGLAPNQESGMNRKCAAASVLFFGLKHSAAFAPKTKNNPAVFSIGMADIVSEPSSIIQQEVLDEVREFGIDAKPNRDMSRAMPFMEKNPILDMTMAGDYGFDPLGLAKTKEVLRRYREAEVKHARLAMLVATGWPLWELYEQNIAGIYSPSVVGGDCDRVEPLFWVFALALSSFAETHSMRRSRSEDSEYYPGNLGFDPLTLYPEDDFGRKILQTAEIKHGRTAMMAVVLYGIEEAVFNKGVIDQTPYFFFN